MTRQFAISPDVNVRNITDWFILNTKVQRMTGEAFHATAYTDFADLHRAYAAGQVDLVFANAADTALLVREHGYLPIAAATGMSKEASIVVSADGALHSLGDLPSHLAVASTAAPDVERICRILLEPADLEPQQITLTVKRNYVLVAKALLTGQAEAGFFLRAAYDSLSDLTRRDLRPLISSQIYVVSHALLVSPAITHLRDVLGDDA